MKKVKTEVQGRRFNVCEFCGGWWESTTGKNAAPTNYVYRFFLEEHEKCPRPAGSEDIGMSVRVVHESDPGFKLLDPAKEWRPENCPKYRAPVTPSVKVMQGVAEKDLLGWWVILYPTSEGWCFNADGSGLLGFFSIALLEVKFQWRMSAPNKIELKSKSPLPDPAPDFFFNGKGSLTMEDRTNAAGEISRVLRIKGPGGRMVELVKRPDSVWQDWKDSMGGLR